MDRQRIRTAFRNFSHHVSDAVGAPWAFIAAVAIVAGWAITGPFFRFSDTWQLVINTGTTIVTFLMVFLIQNTQNRDARAMQLKLDELIYAMKKARNDLIDLEDASDEELKQLRNEFRDIRADHHRYHGITLAPEGERAPVDSGALPRPPVPAAHQHHEARHQQQPHDRRVEHDAEHQREAE